jgi:hypothetical protein
MKKKKNKLVDGVFDYGDYDATDDLKQEILVRTTMFLGVDLVRKLKAQAAKKNIRYQQLLREILYAHFDESQSLEKRIRLLEEEVFKKRA